MRKHFTKKRVALLAGLAVAAALAVAGYAYVTSGGSGSGTASVGTSTDFVLHGSASDALYPGTSSTVTLTVDNNGSGQQYLDTIHLDSIQAYPTALDRTNDTNQIIGCGLIDEDDGSGSNAGTADFYMADVQVANDYAPGPAQAAPDGTLYMNDLAISQDACKSAFLKLNLSSN